MKVSIILLLGLAATYADISSWSSADQLIQPKGKYMHPYTCTCSKQNFVTIKRQPGFLEQIKLPSNPRVILMINVRALIV